MDKDLLKQVYQKSMMDASLMPLGYALDNPSKMTEIQKEFIKSVHGEYLGDVNTLFAQRQFNPATPIHTMTINGTKKTWGQCFQCYGNKWVMIIHKGRFADEIATRMRCPACKGLGQCFRDAEERR